MTSTVMKVRNRILDRIKLLPFFSNPSLSKAFTYTKNRSLQVQPDSIPVCGVYFLQETRTPDGDSNAGEPRFRVNARYGISVILINNDLELAEDQLDLAAEAIRNGLLTDPTIYRNDDEPDSDIQGFSFEMRRHNFGSSLENETPFAELQMEMNIDLGSITYPPVIEDNLEIINVKTAFPLGGTEEEQEAVQQVVVQYDLPQN